MAERERFASTPKKSGFSLVNSDMLLSFSFVGLLVESDLRLSMNCCSAITGSISSAMEDARGSGSGVLGTSGSAMIDSSNSCWMPSILSNKLLVESPPDFVMVVVLISLLELLIADMSKLAVVSEEGLGRRDESSSSSSGETVRSIETGSVIGRSGGSPEMSWFTRVSLGLVDLSAGLTLFLDNI